MTKEYVKISSRNANLFEERQTYYVRQNYRLFATCRSLFYSVHRDLYSYTKDRKANTSYFLNRIALRVIITLSLLKRICMTWLKSDLTCCIFFWHLVIFSHVIVQEMAREIAIFRDKRYKSALISSQLYSQRNKEVGIRIEEKKKQITWKISDG